VIEKVIEKNPNITKEEILEIIEHNDIKEDILKEYGIYTDIDSYILVNDTSYKKFLIIDLILFLILFLVLFLVLFKDKIVYKKNIRKLTKYFNSINLGNYDIDINDNKENELSILKNEIYKTTIMLKEQASNSQKDKYALKESLEDISHQLKTPLTAITIMLDNVTSDNIDNKVKMRFLSDIKKEVSNINFLVQNLLKLSRFDVNAITYNISLNKLEDIICESLNNLSSLSDLKNVKIKHIKNESVMLKCDYKWEVEAITNIIKNCIEHTENGTVKISYNDCKTYIKLVIEDNGVGINKEDIAHIFERFYKGANSSKDSVGIGLSLSLSIIEKDNGKIDVESKKGTTFTIRYYKY
ncbi:MAG: HAMP domain-containing sensor histidine kinase, partial [Bacilli bacterium]